MLDVWIEAASGVSMPARRGGRVVCPIDRIGSAAILFLPDLPKRGEQSMHLTNPSAGSWRRSYRRAEANFDHVECKLTGKERGTTAVRSGSGLIPLVSPSPCRIYSGEGQREKENREDADEPPHGA